MNKRKKVAILKHRRKRKKLEIKQKALLVASGGAKPAVKAAPKKEKEMPKPVKALADILKPKETAPAKKAPVKKEKVEAEKKPEVAAKAEKPKKAPARKKAESAAETKDAKAESAKKVVSKKKKTEES